MCDTLTRRRAPCGDATCMRVLAKVAFSGGSVAFRCLVAASTLRSVGNATYEYVRTTSVENKFSTYVYTRFKDYNRYQVRGTYEYVRTIWQRCTRVLTRHMYTHMYQVSYIPRVVFIILRSINYHGYASHLDHGSVRIFVVGTLMLHRSQVPGPRYDAAEL